MTAGGPRSNEVYEAAWQTWGPMFFSEEAEEGGFLGVDHSSGVDTRWDNLACLGAQRNAVSTTAAASPANANAFDVIQDTGGSTDWFGYLAHGNKSQKIKLSDMSLVTEGSANLAERCTDILTVENDAGTIELCEFMAATAFRVRPQSGIDAGGGSDTVSNNNESKIYRVALRAPDAAYGANGQDLDFNILSGTVTMDASAFQNRSKYLGASITPTGLCMNKGFIVWGTNKGPLLLNKEFGRFFPLGDDLGINAENCRAMDQMPWEEIGAVIPTAHATRSQSGLFGQTIGPEVWAGNTSPIHGILTGLTHTPRWALGAYRSAVNSTTYLVAFRPRQPGDGHLHPVSWYCLGSMSNASELCFYYEDSSVRTNPTWIIGNADDFDWVTLGRTDRWIDDANYRYQPDEDQTLYLTTLRRLPHLIKYPEWIEFTAEGLAASVTIAVQLVADDGTAVTVGVFGAREASSGGLMRCRVQPHALESVFGLTLKPQLVFRTNAATVSPVVRGKLRMGFRVGPAQVDGEYLPAEVA